VDAFKVAQARSNISKSLHSQSHSIHIHNQKVSIHKMGEAALGSDDASNVALTTSSTSGRSLVAARDLDAGVTLFSEPALFFVPSAAAASCAHCLAPLLVSLLAPFQLVHRTSDSYRPVVRSNAAQSAYGKTNTADRNT
jgi:hypothetical protein